LHGQIDNHAHLTPPQFVSREATGRLATTAMIVIAIPPANGLSMLLKGIQN
jgi:hypothetical protein